MLKIQYEDGNGTWVNAEKIEAEVKLKDGGVLQFDRIKFIVSSPT